jgi:hypothetical protein
MQLPASGGKGQGWWYGQHMQIFMKRRDVQRTKDADWFLTVKGRRFLNPPSWAIGTLSAYRKGLTYRVSPAEQGKPVLLLSRKGHRKVIRWKCGQQEEGESKGRSVAERILATSANRQHRRTAKAGRLPSGLSHEKT